MRRLTFSLIAGAAALAAGGVAYAQSAQTPQRELTRVVAEQRAGQMFDRLDANHDGKLDQADREARQKARFDRLDTNHDGQVSYAEFTAARAQFAQARKDRQAKAGEQRGQSFGRPGEHRMAMRGGFRGRGGSLGLFHADKDGTITKADFVNAALQRFDRLDANHDGTVTRDEAKAARDNMRRQWQSRHQARSS
jgi:Ca2+-binding EF-hand superfamily protein